VLERKFQWLERFDLLLVDELGYIPFEREQTTCSSMYLGSLRTSSIAITTNLAFEQ